MRRPSSRPRLLASIGSVAAAMSIACSAPTPSRLPAIDAARGEVLDAAFEILLREHGVLTAGVGVIRNGELVWSGHYGEHAPGIPASATTQFDVASITKTVTTEAILRLVDAGLISLDEPMAAHWLDPDVAQDPRAARITPRMALSHGTGFPNWRFLSDEGDFDPDLPLRFRFDPGTSYGYSGEGFEYLARFVEGKLGVDFEDVVRQRVFEPIGLEGAAWSIREANFANIVQARDEDGVFHGHYCRPSGWCREEGAWSAADDLRVTVADHARFLAAVMRADGYAESIANDRDRVQVEKWNVPESILVRCEDLPRNQCPKAQGYGLGWEVADYGDHELLSHGGSDWSEVAIAYFYSDTHDGVIIFLNAPNDRAVAMMPHALALVHPGSPLIPHYARW